MRGLALVFRLVFETARVRAHFLNNGCRSRITKVKLTLVTVLAAASLAFPLEPVASRPVQSGGGANVPARRAEFLQMFARGYFPGRTGQVLVVPREGDIVTRDEPDIAYMHGSPWEYDTAIPLLFAGPAILGGVYGRPATQQDVAATIASVIGATMPPATSGRLLPIVKASVAPPRAVLLVVLDGMRRDYFERHAAALPVLTALRKRGAWFSQARVTVLPTNTAVAHSTISTGADPRAHGITGNNLYDPVQKKRHDMMEAWDPKDLAALTLADVWQLQTAGRAVVIGQGSSVPASVALAGHGGCQLGGNRTLHAGYDERTGRWRTKAECFTLPETVGALDVRTLWPSDGTWMGHKIDTTSGVRRSGLFPRFEADAFLRLIESQPVGKDDVPDLLLLNSKAPDYVGHKHGPESAELAATLAEMDRHLGRVFEAVEKRTGGQYLIAITADHGMPSEPAGQGLRHFAPAIVDSIPARFDPEKKLVTYYEPENAQIFVDRDRLAALELTLKELAAFMQSQPFIFAAFTEDEVRAAAARLK
jgi:hypothetical protein